MNKYNLHFHHLGLMTKDFKKTVFFLKNLEYQIGEEVFDHLQKVNLRLCTHSKMPKIEVIYKTDKTNDGPLDSMLKKHNEGVYHTCYTTNNLEDSLNKINKENQLMTISPPKKAILFQNKSVSFHLIRGFGLIEILEL